MSSLSDNEWLQRELSKVVSALGETLAPFCEVILGDLTTPDHLITQIENRLSGRNVGDPATALGLARIADPTLPDVFANYANSFEDGRPAKSTSIGIRDKDGNYIAIMCLSIDISYLQSLSAYLQELTRVNDKPEALSRILNGSKQEDVTSKILAFAAKRNRDPRSLNSDEKREILSQLAEEGELERRGAVEKIAATIGVTRSNVYYYLKKQSGEKQRNGAARTKKADKRAGAT